MKCPRCGAPLTLDVFEGQQVHVCDKCKGEWLDAGELKKILDHHNQVFTPAEIASIEGVNKEIFTAEKDDHDELNCPVCGVSMEHFNYGDTSGVILHRCTQCNGIWTDKDQLVKVEELVDGWKACLADDEAKYGGVLKKVEIEEDAEEDKAVSISRAGFVNAVLRHFCEN